MTRANERGVSGDTFKVAEACIRRYVNDRARGELNDGQLERELVAKHHADVLDSYDRGVKVGRRQVASFSRESVGAKKKIRTPLPWRPFPTSVLPEPLRSFVIEASDAIGCDPAQIAVPLLPVLAGCIGNKRRIVLKRGWSEPSVIWAVTVARSGTLKPN